MRCAPGAVAATLGDAGTPPPGGGNFTGSKDQTPLSGRHWHNAFIGQATAAWGLAPVASLPGQCRPARACRPGNLSEWGPTAGTRSYRRAPSDGVASVQPGLPVAG
ncbi:hypothetical protein ACE0DR_28910 [Azotobacter sp. CWF10]